MWEPRRDLPPVLFDAVERIRESVYYQRWQFAELGDHKRSERLEALVLVLQVLVYRTDLVSLRVGTPASARDEWFRGITADYIARWTGLRLGRVVRALDDLRWAGYITSMQPREVDEATGEYTGLAAVRNVTMKLWTRLRMKDKMDSARLDACRRTRLARLQVRERNAKVRRVRRQVAAKVAQLAGGAGVERRLGDRSRFVPELSPDAARLRERRERLESLMGRLYVDHPDWDYPTLHKAALKLL